MNKILSIYLRNKAYYDDNNDTSCMPSDGYLLHRYVYKINNSYVDEIYICDNKIYIYGYYENVLCDTALIELI